MKKKNDDPKPMGCSKSSSKSKIYSNTILPQEVRRGDQDTDIQRERTISKYREKMAIYKIRKEATEETNPAGTLILYFQAPEM